jgi:methionine aminopeptidase, type I
VLVRNDHDRQGLLAIGKIIAAVLAELAGMAAPGCTTAQIDREAGRLLAMHGAAATPAREYDFPGNLCISVNDEVVHGVPGPRVLGAGDLVKLDLTADKDGFVADAARMVVLSPADDMAGRLAESARRACYAAISMAKAGTRLESLGGMVQGVAGADGFRVIRELCGHGVGRRTHETPEVPNFADEANDGVLREGMVITIEPIISAGGEEISRHGDGWTMTTLDGSWSGHYEETVIVGEHGAEVVTTV